MFAGELINPVISPVKLSDSVQKALVRMTEFHLKHIPLVDGPRFLGLLSEETLIDIQNQEQQFKELPISLQQSFVFENQHAYDVLKQMHEQKLSALPVLGLDKKYLGLIDYEGLIGGLANLTSAELTGSIVVLEITHRDNSLAHVAQIVEADHAEILSSYVRSFPDSTRMQLTLKLNRTEISSIISAFQRYNYTVLAVFNDLRIDDDHHSRYDQLMNYLDI
jgi:CBS domain-containing protein